MIAQSRIFYRAARETKSKIGKAARYTAITGMAAALPLLSLAGAEAYQRVRPITNHYAPYFNEINASAGRCYVTTPHDVALVLYHESRHAKQFRTDNQPWIFNGVFVEGEVRMRERIMARELTRTTRDAAFLESTATRTIPELAGVYLYACRESRMPANLFLLARVAREAGPYLGAELEEHSLGTAIYMMAINNAGEEIVERERRNKSMAR